MPHSSPWSERITFVQISFTTTIKRKRMALKSRDKVKYMSRASNKIKYTLCQAISHCIKKEMRLEGRTRVKIKLVSFEGSPENNSLVNARFLNLRFKFRRALKTQHGFSLYAVLRRTDHARSFRYTFVREHASQRP